MPAEERPEPNTRLPGFDVWMPKGIVQKQTTHPAIGSYQVRSGTMLPALPKPFRDLLPERAPSTKVSWRVETAAFSELVDVAPLLDGAMSTLPIKGKGKVVAVAEGRWTSTYEFGKGKLVAGYARCEPWLTIMFIVGLEGDVYDESVAQKMVRSVRCRIDKQKVPSLEVPLRVPAHYGRALNTDERTYLSTSGGGLVTSITEGNIARDHGLMKKVLGGMFSAALGAKGPLDVATAVVAREDGAISTLNTLTGDMGEAGASEFQVGTLYCEDMDATVMLMVFAESDPGTDALAIAKSLECPAADGGAIELPTIDAVFSPLCESGELAACRSLIEFIGAGSAAGNVMPLDRAKERACALGDRGHCA